MSGTFATNLVVTGLLRYARLSLYDIVIDVIALLGCVVHPAERSVTAATVRIPLTCVSLLPCLAA
jgi:hypothetical protein